MSRSPLAPCAVRARTTLVLTMLSTTVFASTPAYLWHLYVDNLVNYKADSWVYSIASTCRLLAFVIIIPFILLTLLVRRSMQLCTQRISDILTSLLSPV